MFRTNIIGRRGFTLIEVMVALAIVSIALLAAMRAAGLTSSQAADLRSRVLADWIAQNIVAEQRARGDWLSLGSLAGAAKQGGYDFNWHEQVSATPHASFRRIDVEVSSSQEPARVLARLTGFLVQPPQR